MSDPRKLLPLHLNQNQTTMSARKEHIKESARQLKTLAKRIKSEAKEKGLTKEQEREELLNAVEDVIQSAELPIVIKDEDLPEDLSDAPNMRFR